MCVPVNPIARHEQTAVPGRRQYHFEHDFRGDRPENATALGRFFRCRQELRFEDGVVIAGEFHERGAFGPGFRPDLIRVGPSPTGVGTQECREEPCKACWVRETCQCRFHNRDLLCWNQGPTIAR